MQHKRKSARTTIITTEITAVCCTVTQDSRKSLAFILLLYSLQLEEGKGKSVRWKKRQELNFLLHTATISRIFVEKIERLEKNSRCQRLVSKLLTLINELYPTDTKSHLMILLIHF